MSNIITQEETKSKDFMFDEQPLHTPISAQNVIMAKTMANNVSNLKLEAPAGSVTSLTFNHRPVMEDFVDNGVILRVTLPVKIERVDDPVEDLPDDAYITVNEENYVRRFFENFSHLALKPNGLTNAIENMTVTLNGTQVSNISNVAAQIHSIFPYYDESEVNEFFEASAPDRFQRYAQYDGSKEAIRTKCPYQKGKNVRLANSERVADQSIFANSYKYGHNTRKPVFRFGSVVGKLFTGEITLESYLPLSIFGLRGSETAIYGIQDMDINIQLKAEPISYIFSMKETAIDIAGVKTLPFSRLYLDSAKTNDQNASLLLMKRKAADHITGTMKGANGLVENYVIEYSDTKAYNCKSVVVGSLATTETVFLTPVNSSAVPKSIYIAAIRKLKGSSAEKSNTPTVYGRISDLTIRMNGITTLYTHDSGTLYNICKGNGLNSDREMGLYTAGFPLKFDMANDIGSGGLTFVGEQKQCTFDIDLQVTNLDEHAHEYEIFVTLVYQTYLEYVNGDFRTSSSLISHEMHKDLTAFGQQRYAQRARQMRMIGGGFWGDLWGGIKKGAKKVGNYVLDNPQDAIGMVRTFLGRGSTHNVMGGATGSRNISGGSQLPISNMLGAGNTGVKNVLGGRAVKSAIFK